MFPNAKYGTTKNNLKTVVKTCEIDLSNAILQV